MKPESLHSRAVIAGRFLALFIIVAETVTAHAGGTRVLHGHVPEASVLTQPLGRLPETSSLPLTIDLPLRNRDELTHLLERVYDPTSPDYHHYLTPAQFNEKFGPTAQDYQRVADFAASNGFQVVATHDSRLLLDVRGQVSDIERAFHVTLRNYQHPTEKRQFYAPEAAPSVEADLPISDVCGLDNYAVPFSRPRSKRVTPGPIAASGSGVDGYYLGTDFRHAYAPGVSLTGAGQMVGLLELDTYYPSDITTYESLAGLPNVPLINVNVTNTLGAPGANVIEVSLDIELAIAMAPGLSGVVVFQAGVGTNVATTMQQILDSMASSNAIKQFSSSWGYTGSPDPNTNLDAWFMKLASQGQSFFQASGDGDAWINPIWVPADSPYVTSVGGTSLTMNGSGSSYNSETVWNDGNQGSDNGWSANESAGRHSQNDYIGSGGGASTVYPIPAWQTNAVNSTNHGSTSKRNIPDVALTAEDLLIVASNGNEYAVGGTSCAAPMWAGFTALINQQAAAGGSAVGFLNPALYALGASTNYAAAFHDITTGNDTNLQSTNRWLAVPGYDLCTGWGTPNGAALINALSPEPLRITPLAGFASSGPFGGPFSVTNQIFDLTNGAPLALTWVIVNTNSWLAPSSNSGVLPSGVNALVNIGLSPGAASLPVGSYSGVVTFSNLNDAVAQDRLFSLTVAKGTPVLTWAAPAPITYGTPLGPGQLDATANTPGNFVYNPAANTVLTVGSYTLAVTFTPDDTIDYSNASASVNLTVSPAPLTVMASNATRIYGQTNPVFTGLIIGLTNGDNITAAYSSSAMTNSPAGMYAIVPSLVDPGNLETNYIVTLSNGTLTVEMALPGLSWAAPANVIYGTALSSNQLDATANVPGNFAYTPGNGTILGPGTNLLSVLFTPSDATDYSNATDAVPLVVTLAPIALNIQLAGSNVILTWNDPASAFALQSAPNVTNVFTNIPGAISPFTNAITGGQQYFRLSAPPN